VEKRGTQKGEENHGEKMTGNQFALNEFKKCYF